MIYRLCIESKVYILNHHDHLVSALHTLDPNLIKIDKNPMALQRMQSLPMPELFALEPTHEGSTTAPATTPAATTIERP